MFDVGFDEMLVVAIVAIVVIGPKDLPMALRAAGRWIAKVRKVSGHFRSGVETMIREAELEEMEKKWAAQNAAIMNADPHPEPQWSPCRSLRAKARSRLPLPRPRSHRQNRRPPPRLKSWPVMRQARSEPTLPFPLP